MMTRGWGKTTSARGEASREQGNTIREQGNASRELGSECGQQSDMSTEQRAASRGLGRLESVRQGAHAVSYTYEASGARATKTTSGGRTTYVGPHFRHEESAGCAAAQNTYCSLRSTYVYT